MMEFGFKTRYPANRWRSSTFSKGDGIMMLKAGEKAVLHGSGVSVPREDPGWNARGARDL